MKLFAILVTGSVFLSTACVGSNDNDGLLPYQPSGDGDADADDDTTPVDMKRCDNTGDCWNKCWTCAMYGPCRAEYGSCISNPDCKSLESCISGCSNAADWMACSTNCHSTHPAGKALLDDYWGCMYCEACASDCASVGYGCGDYEGHDTDTGVIDTDNLVWRQTNITHYTSYPDPGSEECINYNGCLYEGYFAYWPTEKKTESWVQANNIVAVHSKDWQEYRGKLLRIRQGGYQIDAWVYDFCSDADCDGCCTRNAPTGFLLDLESYTYQRFGGQPTTGEFACLTCN